VHFGSSPSGPTESVTVDAAQTLSSLWFDAAMAYTLSGQALTLGSNLADGERLVTVTNAGGDTGSETVINPSVTLANNGGDSRTWLITNQSEGGLGFFGSFDLGGNSLTLTGGQATHLAGPLSGTGAITLTTLIGETPTHLVLSGANNPGGGGGWSGALTIHAQAFGVVKSATGLGSGANTVQAGGTIAWRRHDSPGSQASYATQPIFVEGQGVIRQTGIAAVGAIYNDGGSNTYWDKITMTGDTWFGSRGDLGGNLLLRGQISDGGAGYTFTKVGPGLITLGVRWNPGDPTGPLNTWGQTVIRDGVLRRAHNLALPNANIRFEGGILELTSGPAAPNANFTRNLGTGLGPEPHREIRVERGVNTSAYAILSGQITTSGGSIDFDNLTATLANTGLLKTGHGLLLISHEGTVASISDFLPYLFPYIIRGGALLPQKINGAILSPIRLDGGVLGLDSDLNVDIGTDVGQIQWLGHGGFAAYGGVDREVYLYNGTSHIWGSQYFLPNNAELRFGHYTASSTVIYRNDLLLNSGASHTIRIERGEANRLNGRADVLMKGEFLSDYNLPAVDQLNFVGDGRFDISDDQTLTVNQINIKGAELRLNQGGRFENEITFNISHGGAFILDNNGTHDPDWNGTVIDDRLYDLANVNLNAGHLALMKEHDGTLFLEGLAKIHVQSGANILGSISKGSAGGYLLTQKLTHTGISTLHVVGESDDGYFLTIMENPNLHVGALQGIIPWLTIGDRWGIIIPGGSSGWPGVNYILADHSNAWSYQTSLDANQWGIANNVYVGESMFGGSSTALPSNANKTINSLILNGVLNLNGRDLTLRSGGLLSTPPKGEDPSTHNSTITGSTGSRLMPAGIVGRLYIHIYGNRLDITGGVLINAAQGVVKTGPGELRLNSTATHDIGSLYIHQGTVNLMNGRIQTSGEIFVGDGAGTDILQLRGNFRDQLIANAAGTLFPKLTLHGTPYDPRGPEYGGDQAILRMGGNTKQHLSELHIKERGTIDWVGGEVSKANILYLDKLTFSGPDAILFMKNWYEYEDILLVKKGWFNGLTAAQQAQLKSQVWFEGYENFPVLHRNYDANYYQITPFLHREPEPATTGAILGTVGLGLVAWRKRKMHDSSSLPKAG